MQPIKIEFELTSPVAIAAYPLHLDSLVAYAIVERAKTMGLSGDVRDIILDLPLEKAERDGEWCWKASRLKFDPGVRNIRQWTRRTDTADYSSRYASGQVYSGNKNPPQTILAAQEKALGKLTRAGALKIDILRGDFKNHQQFFEVERSPRAVAYCVGDLDEISSLLSLDAGFITSLGKRGTRGFGKISRTIISIDDAAVTHWKDRVLPWEEDGFAPLAATVRPPYFDRTLVQQAWIPV